MTAPMPMSLMSPDLLVCAEEGAIGRLESPRRTISGGKLRDSKNFSKSSSSVRITVLCNASGNRSSQTKDSEVKRVYVDELEAAEAGQVGLGSLKSHKSPIIPVSALCWLSIKTDIGMFLARALKVLSVLGCLGLVALLAVPLLSPGKRNVEDFQDNISLKSSRRFGPRSFGPPNTAGASARSLLAEGLASVAAKLDEDTVDNYAKPKGYIRKSLMSARVQIDLKQHDMESLQDYYEKQIKAIIEDHKAQKEVYEKRLHAQETILDVVFGEDRPDADSEGTSALPKPFSDGGTGNQSYESCLDPSTFVSPPSASKKA